MRKNSATPIRAFTIALFAGSAAVAAAQSTAPPAPAPHTGCVTAMADDPKSFVLSEPSGCSLLSGKLATKQLAGHVVTLRGTFLDATPTDPQTIVIEGVQSVGAACQETCTLEPPGHRGLHKKEKTGSPGGTPGS